MPRYGTAVPKFRYRRGSELSLRHFCTILWKWSPVVQMWFGIKIRTKFNKIYSLKYYLNFGCKQPRISTKKHPAKIWKNMVKYTTIGSIRLCLWFLEYAYSPIPIWSVGHSCSTKFSMSYSYLSPLICQRAPLNDHSWPEVAGDDYWMRAPR